MSVTWLSLKNISLTCLLLLSLTLLGCSNISATQQNANILDIDSTQFALYWVAKDTLIDWHKSLPKASESNSELVEIHYLISFVVNSDGQMRQLKIINSTTGVPLETSLLTQQFYPTVRNSKLQAVRINTRVQL